MVWQDDSVDGDGWGIVGRAYDDVGNGGTQFVINQATIGDQTNPAVVALSVTELVVAWESTALPVPGDPADSGIYHLRLDALTLAPIGSETLSNTFLPGFQQRPAVSGLSKGDFVVAWEGAGPFSDSDGIYARWFDATPPAITGLSLVPAGGNVLAQGGPSGVSAIVVELSEPVNIDTTNWTVTGEAAGDIVFVADYDAHAWTVTLTFTTPAPEDSFTVQVPEDSVVSETGSMLDGDGDGLPGGDFTEVVEPCRTSAVPQPEVAGRNRFLSFTAGFPGRPQAVRITFDDLPVPFDVVNGQEMWVAQPFEVCENSGQDETVPIIDCAVAPGLPTPTFWAARLGCEPVFVDWTTIPEPVSVFHEFVVPSGQYSVRVVDISCPLNDTASFPDPLVITNPIWGDVTGGCGTSTCLPPDGSVDITTDVTGCLDKFKNLITGPSKARTDVEPSILDLTINISDVTFVLDAFGGKPYPFAPSTTEPCP